MISPFVSLIGIGLVGALTAPIIMLTLARFGLFEPIEFEMFGKTYLFAPNPRRTDAFSNAVLVMFPTRQTAFASVVTAALIIGVPDGNTIRNPGIASGSPGTTFLREV